MQELLLQNIKEKYNELKRKRIRIIKLHQELERLKEDKNVKRYIELLREGINTKILNEDELIEATYLSIFKGFDKEDIVSNKIMIFIGCYNDISITSEEDSNIKYYMYKDLETGREVSISKDNILKYEDNNITLYPKVDKISKEEYLKCYTKLQEYFMKNIIYYDQEEAIEKLFVKIYGRRRVNE